MLKDKYALWRVKYLRYILQDWFISYHQNGNQLDVTVSTEYLVPALTVLKSHEMFQLDTLVDIVGLDYRYVSTLKRADTVAKEAPVSGFKLVYSLLSVKLNYRVNLHVSVPSSLLVPSIAPLFSSAVWFEREVWDMFGLHFKGNPDLRRILSDYQFSGFALRKDFPVAGYTEVFFYDMEARLVYLPLALIQESKQFKTSRTWLD